MSNPVEVVIVGGGPAGAAAAIELARLGRRVLLANRDEGSDFRIGEAAPPAVRPLLRDLGVLDRVLADGHLPCYGNVSVRGFFPLLRAAMLHLCLSSIRFSPRSQPRASTTARRVL